MWRKAFVNTAESAGIDKVRAEAEACWDLGSSAVASSPLETLNPLKQRANPTELASVMFKPTAKIATTPKTYEDYRKALPPHLVEA